ncbi:MAG TPA: glycosyltransferase [Pyrinomonadaceae bacterium]|nr:glycosyltransferase [Pyrinomonadaceae bacterium]
MRIVLLALDGEAARAEKVLRARYPRAEVKILPRAEVERGTPFARLRALRTNAPDAFAVSTERLAWQQGQNALKLFGALAGARRLMMLDAHGGFFEEQRGSILWRSPARFAAETLASGAAILRARRELKRLERAVAGGGLKAQRALVKSATSATDATHRDDAPRIAYLRATPAAGTQVGGATSHINGFINAALELGARLSVISNDRIAGLDESKVELIVVEPQPTGLTRAAFDLRNGLLFGERAAQEISMRPPDFIYQRYSRFSWAGVEASLATGRPLFLEYNGSEVWMGRHWDRAGLFDLLERAERLNLEAAARIFVVADVERRNLLRAGVAPEKIVVNSNGVDVQRFRPGVGGREVRAELGIDEDETLVGFTGTFGPWHGVLVLAEAATLLSADARVRFLLVGSGSQRERAEEILRRAGALGRVHFTGAVAHERVPALLDACDVLASPHVPLEGGAEFFGSPTKLFEYMAMGKGIVASRLGQIADVLRDEETALLVEPGDALALKNALERMAASPELRARLGAAARAACVARHTWAHNAGRVLDAYRSLSLGLDEL